MKNLKKHEKNQVEIKFTPEEQLEKLEKNQVGNQVFQVEIENEPRGVYNGV